jgi:hypothetical protein
MNNENDSQTTAVAVRASALPMRGLADIVTAGQLLAASGMFGCKNDAAGFVVVATCQQEGVSLMEFIRTYDVIDGKPCKKAAAMLAEFIKRGGKHVVIERTENVASVELEKDGKKLTFTLAWEDAQKEPFVFKADGKSFKKNYATPRARMQTMWSRVISDGVRTMDPGVNAGVYTPEEIEDLNDRPQRTDAAPVALAQQDAAARAKSVTAETVTPAVIGQSHEPRDCTICPIGGEEFEGKPWTEFETEMLEALLASDDAALTKGYKLAIKLVLDERKNEGGAA